MKKEKTAVENTTAKISPKKEKTITISAKVAFQNSGILFELNESQTFNESEMSLDEISNLKMQILTNNLITLNNFQKEIEA